MHTWHWQFMMAVLDLHALQFTFALIKKIKKLKIYCIIYWFICVQLAFHTCRFICMTTVDVSMCKCFGVLSLVYIGENLIQMLWGEKVNFSWFCHPCVSPTGWSVGECDWLVPQSPRLRLLAVGHWRQHTDVEPTIPRTFCCHSGQSLSCSPISTINLKF